MIPAGHSRTAAQPTMRMAHTLSETLLERGQKPGSTCTLQQLPDPASAIDKSQLLLVSLVVPRPAVPSISDP
jgi:hypothetical protein